MPLFGVFLGVATYKWSIVESTPLLTSFQRKNVEYVELCGVYTTFDHLFFSFQKWYKVV